MVSHKLRGKKRLKNPTENQVKDKNRQFKEEEVKRADKYVIFSGFQVLRKLRYHLIPAKLSKRNVYC